MRHARQRVPKSPFGHTHNWQHHSSFGKRCGMAGPHTRIFYVWAAVMRQVRPKVIIAESVTQLGLQPYERELGDICACVRTVVSAAEQAMNLPLCWQRLAHPLRCLCSKTSWLRNQCCACLRGNAFTPGGRIWWQTKQSWRKSWAMNRPGAKKRHADCHGAFHDEPGSFLYALNTSERKKLEQSRKLASSAWWTSNMMETSAPCIRWKES